MSTTLGDALNRAIMLCTKDHPGIEIYGAIINFYDRSNTFVVELSAVHFSQRLIYKVAP